MDSIKLSSTFTILVTVCYLATPAWGAADTVTPVNVTDSSGNHANHLSVITWGDIPQKNKYKISDDNMDYDAGQLNYLHTMVNHFLDVVFIKDTPYTAVKNALDGEFDIAEFGMFAAGFGICVVVGFLFIIIMPIAGCCFCCCRCCCNKCGASKVWKDKYEKSMVTCFICQAAGLLLLSIFLFCGTALLYATNQETGKTVKNLGDIVKDNLDDAKSFVDNTVEEFRHIGLTNFNFTKNVITRDLDNVGFLIGVPVRKKLRTDAAIDDAINAAYALDNLLTTLSGQLNTVNSQTTELNNLLSTLDSELTNVQNDLTTYRSTAACSGNPTCNAACNPAGLDVNVDTGNFPNISSQTATMNSVTQTNIRSNIDSGKADFENIPHRVETDTASTRQSVTSNLDDFVTTIDDGLKDITKLSDDVNPELDSIQDKVDEYFGDDSYDKYRWYGMIGLSCVVLLIVVFMVLGLVGGVFGYGKDPFDKSSLSICGSCFFVMSAMLIFIFAWLLMILCTLTFIVGAPAGAIICKEVKDPSYTIFKELLDGPDSVLEDDGIYPLAKVVLGSSHSKVKVTYSGMLQGCEKNAPAWSVLQLNYRLNLTDITDYKKNVDIDAEINAFNIDLSSVEFFDATTEQQLNDFKEAVNISYDQYITELEKNTVGADLTTKVNDLRAVNTSNATLDANIHAVATTIEGIQNGTFASADNKRAELLQSVKEMKNSSALVAPAVDDAIAKMQKSENYIQTNASSTITQQIKMFADRAVAVADSYVTKVKSGVENEVAKCRPLYNFWHSLLINVMCDQLFGNVNAFWFSLGWCIFFMVPSLILSVKITKYLRQFNSTEGEAGKIPARNQVAPAPMTQPTL